MLAFYNPHRRSLYVILFWVGKLNRRKGSNVKVYFSRGKSFLLRNVRPAFPHLRQNSEGWLNMATVPAVHTSNVACAVRKGSTLPQGGGTEADSSATHAIEKLWDRLLLTGSILTHLSSSSMQNYFCSSPFSFIQLLIDHRLYIRNYARLSGQVLCSWPGGTHTISAFFFITWRSPHSPISF